MPKNLIFSKTLFWIFLPALLWLALFAIRPWLYHASCAVQPTPCTFENLNALDQFGLGFHSIFADFLSNLVQNTVGVILFALPIPLLLEKPRALFRLEAFLLIGTLWNGTCLELVRGLVERPRPLVLHDPMGEGANIHQYTSFYSGHTSFVAFATLLMVFWLKRYAKTEPRAQAYVKVAWILWVLLTCLTATLRIVGGRHYITDTIAGAIAGSIVACVIWKRYSLIETDSI